MRRSPLRDQGVPSIGASDARTALIRIKNARRHPLGKALAVLTLIKLLRRESVSDSLIPAPVAERLIRRCQAAEELLADKAYDSAELRDWLEERGTDPVIPNRSNRKQPFAFKRKSYKLRHKIENAICRLKDFRRIATRYAKLARNFLAAICLVAAIVWWI
jgi:transposase